MDFSRPVFLLLCFCTLIVHARAQAPWKTFAETPPTTDIDSLTKWLDLHPKPTPERLQNLIKAERTYYFLYPEKMGKHLSELERLSKRFNHKAGQATLHYLTGRMLLQDEKRAGAMKEFQQAYAVFKTLKDTSGIIHSAAGLVSTNYEMDGAKIGERTVAALQLEEAEALIKQRSNLHDHFVVVLARCLHMRADSLPDFKAMSVAALKALHMMETREEYAYAWINLQNQVGLGYMYLKQYAVGYGVYQRLLAKLQPDQYFLRIRTMYNLSLAALMMGHFKERLQICLTARALCDKVPKKRPQTLYGLYWSLNEEYNRLKETKKAKLYYDSSAVVYEQIKTLQQKEELIYLQMKYQLLDREKQVAHLQLRQAVSENRIQLILTAAGLVSVAALISILLVLRMRRLNTQLKSLTAAREQFLGMVAHDLRRPLSAFHGMAETVNYYLKEGDFSAIETLSHSIDRSGAQIQQLLDNVVTWAWSQRRELPYDPSVFLLKERVLHTTDMYQAIYTGKQPKFEIAIPETAEVYMDSNAFDLIVRNIIDNTLKAAEYPVYINISAHQDAQHITVSFEDNAGGMAPQQIRIIQQVMDAPEKAQIGENGLGMGIVMIGRFVKRNRGRIVITGTLGHGTGYTLTLPIYP